MDKLMSCPVCGTAHLQQVRLLHEMARCILLADSDGADDMPEWLVKLAEDATDTRHTPTEETGGESPEQELERAIEYAKGWIKKLGHESQPGGHIFDVILELANCRLSTSQTTEPDIEHTTDSQGIPDGDFRYIKPTEEEMDAAFHESGYWRDEDKGPYFTGWQAAYKWMGERK
jgi:hypothetical protein